MSWYFLVCLELLFDLFLFAFCSQMPEKIDIGWSKKMLRSAGLCTTGKLRYPKRERYAKIRISLKVCDSAGDGGSRVAPLPCFLPTPEGLLLGAGVLWPPVSQRSLSLLCGQVYCVLLRGHYYWMSHHHWESSLSIFLPGLTYFLQLPVAGGTISILSVTSSRVPICSLSLDVHNDSPIIIPSLSLPLPSCGSLSPHFFSLLCVISW